MFCIGNVSVCSIAHFALSGDQAVFVFTALLRLLLVLAGTRTRQGRPEFISLDDPFCGSSIPGDPHALFRNDFRRRDWTLWSALFDPKEMARDTNQRMDPRPGRRSDRLRIPLQISNF